MLSEISDDWETERAYPTMDATYPSPETLDLQKRQRCIDTINHSRSHQILHGSRRRAGEQQRIDNPPLQRHLLTQARKRELRDSVRLLARDALLLCFYSRQFLSV